MSPLTHPSSKPLPAYEVILRALYKQKDTLGVPVPTAAVAIVKATAMKDTYTAQFGNTVFISHLDASGKTALFSALSCDTNQKYIRAVVQYLQRLQQNGVTHAICEFDDTQSRTVLSAAFKRAEMRDFGMQVAELSDGGYRAYLDIPNGG